MKKITDERLILRNLQHIKIAFTVQTIGILSILAYELVQNGFDEMRENPLWHVLIITSAVIGYLSMSVSVEHEKVRKNPKKSLMVSLLVITAIVIAVAYLTVTTPNSNWKDGVIIAGVLFICSLIPTLYVYRLRVKQEQDIAEE
ncbi:hypothetical protein ACQKMD_10450 [Viridibacillus sp. NPDC096237]|uniref:hypothetical protein n=1 Tax=Viridibacillus sp. NPDC096237 TaxID=3390721 RepID=UPI003D03C390